MPADKRLGTGDGSYLPLEIGAAEAGYRSSDLSRRDLLRMLGALGVTSIAGLSLEACTKTSPECTKPNSSPPLPITSPPTLAQLRTLIRSSPDHLQARAEEIVATRNPKCIAEFVRDHIAVLPGFQANDDGVFTSRWGIEGTVRAGAGTLRDRAELMMALLGAAGIPAKVRQIDTPSGLTAKELYRPLSHEFSVGEDSLKVMVEAIQKEKDTQASNGHNKQAANEANGTETSQPTGFGKDADPAALVEATAKVITAAIDGRWTSSRTMCCRFRAISRS
jgi:Transglutaminase-like superfamily